MLSSSSSMDPSILGRSDARKRGSLDFQLERYYGTELLASGTVFSKRRSPGPPISGLLQNCDLPPPINIYSPTHDDGDNSSLMRALRLSQTRAREAEKKAKHEAARGEQLALLLLKGSVRLSAHRRWVNLLEIEVSVMETKAAKKKEVQGDEYVDAATWCLAVALCLSIAGVGFALGRYV